MSNVAVPSIQIVTPGAGDSVLGVQAGAVKRFPTDSFVPPSELAKHWFTPETYGGVSYPSRAAAEAGTDSTAALQAAFTAMATSGGTLFLSGWFRATSGFLLPNSNTQTTIGTQPPILITGIGGHATGRGEKANFGSGIVWTSETGAAVAKIDTRGSGLLVLDNCTFASKAGSGNVLPFIHTTFTVVKTGTGFALDGATYGANAAEDAFVLGGQTAHESDAGFDRRSADCGFQGYGTLIDSVHCNGIRRLALLQRYANAIRIENNVLWTTCGNNSATGAAIEIDGAPIVPSTYSVGAYIHSNLIEVTGYKYGVYVKNAAHVDLAGNDCYDATGLTLAAVYVDEATCSNIRIRPSLSPAGKPYLLPAPSLGGAVRIMGAEAGQYDVLNSLKSGVNGYPNEFGDTVFNRPLFTYFQSATAIGGSAKLLRLIRSAAEASDPGVESFSVNGDAGIALGALSGAGNITNALATGASWSANGRTWGFPGRTGAAMGQHSGTGGSVFTASNFSFQWNDQTGAIVGRVGKMQGGASKEGISFGPTFDTEFYRHSSTVMRSNVKVTADGGIGVGNSAAATTLGTLSKKMEVFDVTGASLGFVPIYTTIT